MEFLNNEHKDFFYKKINELEKNRNVDVYYKSLVYTLAICETTRIHFKEIFNIEKGEINLDSINKPWQTGTSKKVTRMAFNLWNDFIVYDCNEDLNNNMVSKNYTPSELFSCLYAQYFWKAIEIRYPEYTNYSKEEIIT